MRQQKETNDRCVGEFEIERFAVQVEKRGIDSHIVPTARRETLDLVQLGDARALGLDDIGLFEDFLA